MLCHAQSGDKPAKVVLTTLPDETVMVSLHDSIKKVTVEAESFTEGETVASTGYEYDEVVFPLPYDHADETVKTITAAFADWWTYGEAYTGEDATPTEAERLDALEQAFAAIMGAM